MKRLLCLTLLVIFLLLLSFPAVASPAAADMDWYTPMTIAGGGPASSVHFSVNMSIGQSVIGNSQSSNFEIDLGYWSGLGYLYRLFLPLLHR